MNKAVEKELNQELIRLARLLPSTDEGIEAMDLVSRAVANVTNENFKRQTIDYVKRKFLMRPSGELAWIRGEKVK